MCRLYVDLLFRRSIRPSSPEFPNRKHQRVVAALIHHTDLQIYIPWRNGDWQPFVIWPLIFQHKSIEITKCSDHSLIYINDRPMGQRGELPGTCPLMALSGHANRTAECPLFFR
jgi:hypothetical protein